MSDKSCDDEDSTELSSSEEEDENAKEWTDEVEKTFLKTLSSLKKKDPKIYDGNIKFFKDELIASKHPPAPKEEHMYLKDYERKIILEKNGILTDEESDEESAKKIIEERAKSPTYVEEQKILKESFKQFLNEDDSNDSDDCAGFLKVKVKTAQEKAKEEADYIEWLKGQKTELEDKQTENELKFLRDYWTDPNLNEGEKFLRDYLLNKRYLEPDENSQNESELSFSEEERVLEECDEYEQKYNFRFEEPDKNFIKTYPRVIESSLRRKDEKRKEKRAALKKRKEEQLEKKRLEVKKLKKQKKQEILERIQKLKELTGNAELGFKDEDLQKDFSPDEYDKKMNELFNEEFYAQDDDCDEKPQFSDSDSYEYDDDDGDVNEEDYFNEEPATEDIKEEPLTEDCNVLDSDYSSSKTKPTGSVIKEELSNEDSNTNMDCDYVSAREKQTRSSRRKGHKKSKLMEAIRKEKPVFNAAEKTFQQYLDEYYSLDFEDMIGDLPCRFKYRKVPPNNFGLTVEEILAADDKELNKWCSMRKIDTIRPENEEKFDQKIYARKGKNLNLKRKYLPSLFKEENQTQDDQQNVDNEATTSKKKKKKRRSKKSAIVDNSETRSDIQSEKLQKSGGENNDKKINRKRKAADDNTSVPTKKSNKNNTHKFNKEKSNFKNKKFKGAFKVSSDKNRNEACEIADERLKAYGINPKRYKNKLKYGPK